jgi:hypothetical protein
MAASSILPTFPRSVEVVKSRFHPRAVALGASSLILSSQRLLFDTDWALRRRLGRRQGGAALGALPCASHVCVVGDAAGGVTM